MAENLAKKKRVHAGPPDVGHENYASGVRRKSGRIEAVCLKNDTYREDRNAYYLGQRDSRLVGKRSGRSRSNNL